MLLAQKSEVREIWSQGGLNVNTNIAPVKSTNRQRLLIVALT